MAAIAGAASSLMENPDDIGSRQELLQTVMDESRRLTRLVENLLEMTKLESGAAAPNRQWHVLEEIIGSAIARLRRDLGDRQVVVQIPSDFPLLYVDDVLMEQVLINLLENAARYTPSQSRIDIVAERLGKRVEMRVWDNGPGLPPGLEKRIFEKFFRGAGRSSDSRRGVGLGLAICLAIVTAHGGRITARNRPEGGAEFLISLPLAEGAPIVNLDDVAAGAQN